MKEISRKFGGENAEMYNALHTSLELCAEEQDIDIYDFLEETPKTSLVVFLVNKLIELGFEIKKK